MHFAQKTARLGDGVALRGWLAGADVDQYTQALIDESWDASVVQLSPGHLNAGIDYLTDDRFVLYREQWSGRLHALGSLNQGMIAFGVPSAPQSQSTWWGRPFPEGRLAFLRAGATLEQINARGEAITVLMIRESEFWPIFNALTGLDPEDFPSNGHFLHSDPAAAASLPATWNRMLAKSAAHADAGFTLADIIAPVLAAIRLPLQAERARGSSGGLVDLVLDAAARRQFRASVPELSVLLKVSRRTIECAFQTHLGEPPHAYFRKRRLASCRQALIEADPADTTVTAVACQHGFTELGRFAGAYCRHFGELPSATLRTRWSAPPLIVSRARRAGSSS